MFSIKLQEINLYIYEQYKTKREARRSNILKRKARNENDFFLLKSERLLRYAHIIHTKIKFFFPLMRCGIIKGIVWNLKRVSISFSSRLNMERRGLF